jgi:hypothetical protein
MAEVLGPGFNFFPAAAMRIDEVRQSFQNIAED